MFNNNAMCATPIAFPYAYNNDGMNGGAWWAWIILLAFCGWGGNGGFFGNGRGGSEFTQGELQRGFDTQTIINKLDGLNNGLCSLGYDQLAQMNNIGNQVTNTGWNIERAIQSDTVANMQNQFALSRQISDCCCENREAIANLKFDMATSDCSIKTLINQVAQQLQWGQMTSFRDLSDLVNNQFCQLRMEQKDAIIAELQAKLNGCDRDTALQSMATYIINTVRPTPTPSWNVQNPWANSCSYGFRNGCNGNCNNCAAGCGCGC